MLKQIINDYEDFGDALITDVKYYSGFDYSTLKFSEESLEITISCGNKNKDYDSELITIYCTQITHLSLKKYNGMIFMAYLNEEESEITMDFFPELLSNPNGGGLIGKPNLNSDCIIKCRAIDYKVIDSKASS